MANFMCILLQLKILKKLFQSCGRDNAVYSVLDAMETSSIIQSSNEEPKPFCPPKPPLSLKGKKNFSLVYLWGTTGCTQKTFWFSSYVPIQTSYSWAEV